MGKAFRCTNMDDSDRHPVRQSQARSVQELPSTRLMEAAFMFVRQVSQP
jgi:hypothetical protein